MSRLVKINDGNVARAINQADNLLGTASGTILLKGDHVLTEQIRLNSNHELRLEKCTLTVSDDFVRASIATNVVEGAIKLADKCKVIGDGQSRIVEPNQPVESGRPAL